MHWVTSKSLTNQVSSYHNSYTLDSLICLCSPVQPGGSVPCFYVVTIHYPIATLWSLPYCLTIILGIRMAIILLQSWIVYATGACGELYYGNTTRYSGEASTCTCNVYRALSLLHLKGTRYDAGFISDLELHLQ